MNDEFENDLKFFAQAKYLRRQKAMGCRIRKRGFKYFELSREIKDKCDWKDGNVQDETSELDNTYIKEANL
jgi:hypothetical protein